MPADEEAAQEGPPRSQIEFVDVNDIAARRGVAGLLGATDEEAAYYWANIAYTPELAAGLPGSTTLRSTSGSPTVLHVRHSGAHTIAVRGSCELSDIATVLALRGLHGRLHHAYCEGTRHMARGGEARRRVQEAFAHVAASVAALPPHAHVHPGILVHAFKCLMLVWPVLGDRRADAVFLYGHSLGAACASLLFVWLRELGCCARPDATSCSVLACPMFANTPAWTAWLSRHDLPCYAHYFMHGDPFVSDLPGVVGLDRAVSRTHNVCPNIRDVVAGPPGALGALGRMPQGRDALMSHSCFVPGEFVTVDGTSHESIERALRRRGHLRRSCERDAMRVLCSPKHVHRVLRLRAAGCHARMCIP